MLTDEQIKALLIEPKQLPANWRKKLRANRKENTRHTEKQLDVERPQGGIFRIILRQSVENPFDFSVILGYADKQGRLCILRRYNGRHPSGHTNRLEHKKGLPNSEFRNTFHIHTATQRYQEADLDIDGFAEPTSRYHDFGSAVDAFLDDHQFQQPSLDVSQMQSLFDGQVIQ